MSTAGCPSADNVAILPRGGPTRVGQGAVAAIEEIGWEIPVLEGYCCAIEPAKLSVDLGISASGLMYSGDRPRRWRRKKVF
jgi:hypothetical protein